jgi:hypothetical protein
MAVASQGHDIPDEDFFELPRGYCVKYSEDGGGTWKYAQVFRADDDNVTLFNEVIDGIDSREEVGLDRFRTMLVHTVTTDEAAGKVFSYGGYMAS